jgi:YggT family protein
VVALANLITTLVSIYTLLILASVVLSWIGPSTGAPGRVRAVVDTLTAPVLRPFRRLVPPLGRFDLSPVLALLTLQVAGGAAASAVATL